MRNMLSVASFTDEGTWEGDRCLSKKWKGERRDGGQGGGFPAGGAAAGSGRGPWRESQQEAGQMAVGGRNGEVRDDSVLLAAAPVGANENRRKTSLGAVETSR